MSFLGDALGDIIAPATGISQAAAGAEQAGATQAGAAGAGIGEEQRQLDAFIELMSPYVTGGQGAFQQQQDILGLGGEGAQQQAISGFEQSPLFQSLAQQQENAILQNASATGGVRGGDVQGALAQFRPQLLNQQIQQQLGNLGGITNLGFNAAGAQGQAGLNTGSNIARLLGQQGAATAGGQLARGQVIRQAFGENKDFANAGASFFGGLF